MSVRELYVKGIIQINITLCKSWWKVLFVSNAKIGFALSLFKC